MLHEGVVLPKLELSSTRPPWQWSFWWYFLQPHCHSGYFDGQKWFNPVEANVSHEQQFKKPINVSTLHVWCQSVLWRTRPTTPLSSTATLRYVFSENIHSSHHLNWTAASQRAVQAHDMSDVVCLAFLYWNMWQGGILFSPMKIHTSPKWQNCHDSWTYRLRMDDSLPFTVSDINYAVCDAQRTTPSEWVCVSVGANCGGAHVSCCVGVPEWAFLPLFPSHEDAANRVCVWRCHFRRLAPPWLCRQDAGKSGRPECNSCQLFLFRSTPHTCWLPKRHICHLMWNNTKNRAPLWTDNTACVWKQHLSLVGRKADK